jgi:hypothetical protein
MPQCHLVQVYTAEERGQLNNTSLAAERLMRWISCHNSILSDNKDTHLTLLLNAAAILCRSTLLNGAQYCTSALVRISLQDKQGKLHQ